ncbi:MAG: hypothetical protein A2W01_00175 [Candidatus Solincola sediminis]|uniref:DUF6036 domain-containing protein n=1 Tax=Candidatus Solincola sediminis TaxID=1797199 RepID=A0A1F2WHJ9_9ACTN|nr:MAG: hypothetical protein A2Y75_03830 [Candidatus Solincola sediminis]OFW61689.1 MAG: hypothetical protein A2W01_00175 [Candidatus Solincola sediminis]
MFKELLERIASFLDRKEIPYMVIGGQAVLVHGATRLTEDIDITLGMGVEAADQLLELITSIGLKPIPDDPVGFARSTSVLPAIEGVSGLRTDFIFSHSSYESEAIKRGTRIRIGNIAVNFASVEDLLIHKLIAGRPRDIEDARIILAKNPGYDREYMLKWLQEFDVALDTDFGSAFKELEKDINQ